MTHYDMSGSEDGQLRSPGDDQFISGDDDVDEHDTDSLDIKPPQATIHHSRNSVGNSKRRDKSNKEKKHSKERRQHRDINCGTGVGADRERERDERDRERRGGMNVGRGEMDRYQRANYERTDDGRRDMFIGNDRRYQKHYERGRDNHAHIHHSQQQQQSSQLHMHRRQQDYYERPNDYHHGNDYHGSNYHVNDVLRQQYGSKHGHRVDYGHEINTAPGNIHRDRDRERERRKYNYEGGQQDAESLEQDLRSRLLSKRHKYVKDYEPSSRKYQSEDGSYEERNHRGYEEYKAAKLERHKSKRENVIEVFDSPEVHESHQHSRKHKRREKEKLQEPIEKRRTPEDPDLLARRARLLEAEREITKRKEVAREELEARREKRRERGEFVDELSPSSVAANVTAGLNVVKRRKDSTEEHIRKKVKSSRHRSDEDNATDTDDDDGEYNEEEEEEDDDDEEEESNSVSDSETESEQYYKNKTKRKNIQNTADDKVYEEDDDVVKLPDSPLSIGELSKSPHKQESKKRHKRANNDVEEKGDIEQSSRSNSHSRSASASRSISHSRESRSRSRCTSHSGQSRSDSRSSRRSNSRSRLGSHTASPRSRSNSHSRSRSRSRSEERDMKANQRKSEAEDEKKKLSSVDGDESQPCDDKGIPLPNYFPGIQGCRSVEEFQCLNRIEEGTYGVVYRAKDKRTNEIVALKRLKMEKEKEGFPITSLREINTLLKGQHPNIVTVREIVVGSNMDKIFIVMDYVEHDLKSLMETMKNRKQSFLPGEVKCLTQQLLRAVGHLHDNWILHRDLKTSNLLLSHKGILKVGDFGLAREYGSPLKKYTSLVVTLWYRAPELLLCSPEYSTPIDIWSVGCIFGEFLQMTPLFPGKSEIDELNRIFKELGTPNEKIWPGYKDLPAVKNLLSQNSQFAEYPVSNLRKRFHDKTSETGISLLQGLLTYDPKQRLNADAALKHPYFKELPLPIDPSMFPTWPAKSELGARKAMASSPKPPSGGSQFKQLGRDDIIGNAAGTNKSGTATGFSGIITGNKKTAANTGFVLNAGIEQRQLAMGPGFNLKF